MRRNRENRNSAGNEINQISREKNRKAEIPTGQNPISISLDRDSREKLLERILDVGGLMLRSGADISRVEDTLSMLCRAYGAVPDVYVIVFSIVVTLRFPDETSLTQTRRVPDSDSIDFGRLDRLNDLSRRCCSHPMTISQLDKELGKIREERARFSMILLGNALGAFSFSIFFEGSLPDGIAAAYFEEGKGLAQNDYRQALDNPWKNPSYT